MPTDVIITITPESCFPQITDYQNKKTTATMVNREQSNIGTIHTKARNQLKRAALSQIQVSRTNGHALSVDQA